jgi:hypothetical protein
MSVRNRNESKCLRQTWRAIALLFGALLLIAATPGGDSTVTKPKSSEGEKRKPPVTPREFYNAGTADLSAGKLSEAESMLENALLSQDEQFQPQALYNLGHVRFGQGLEELKKNPDGQHAADSAPAVDQRGQDALRIADEALASDDVQKMVSAYLNGRGSRRELKAATEAVKRALKQYGVTLRRWQRSSGDFKSALEINPHDSDARKNADFVDRSIAKLIDKIQQMQQMQGMLSDRKEKLGEKLKQLKGKIPAPNMPPGAGEDEEDEDSPFGKEPGQKEGDQREGKETGISPEQAGWLLDAFKLDSERKLPMSGMGKEGKPRERTRPTW